MVKVRFYGEPKKKNRKRDWSGNFTTPFTLCGYITSQRGEGYIIYYLFLHHLLLNVGQNIGHGLRRPICIVSSRFPFFSLLNGNLKWAEQLVIQALFFFANRKQKCVYFSLASCSANTRRLDAMKDRTPVWDYALHSGGLSAVRYTAVSFFLRTQT